MPGPVLRESSMNRRVGHWGCTTLAAAPRSSTHPNLKRPQQQTDISWCVARGGAYPRHTAGRYRRVQASQCMDGLHGKLGGTGTLELAWLQRPPRAQQGATVSSASLGKKTHNTQFLGSSACLAHASLAKQGTFNSALAHVATQAKALQDTAALERSHILSDHSHDSQKQEHGQEQGRGQREGKIGKHLAHVRTNMASRRDTRRTLGIFFCSLMISSVVCDVGVKVTPRRERGGGGGR